MIPSTIQATDCQELSDFVKKYVNQTTALEDLEKNLPSAILHKLICFLIHNDSNINADLKYKIVISCLSRLTNENNSEVEVLDNVVAAIRYFIAQSNIDTIQLHNSNELCNLLLSCIEFLSTQNCAPYSPETEISKAFELIRALNLDDITQHHIPRLLKNFFQLRHLKDQKRVYVNFIEVFGEVVFKTCEPRFKEQAQNLIEDIEPFLKDFMTPFCNYYLIPEVIKNLSFITFFKIEKFLQLKMGGRISLFKRAESKLLNLYKKMLFSNHITSFIEFFFQTISVAKRIEVKLPLAFVWEFTNLSGAIYVSQLNKFPLISNYANLKKILETDCSDLLIIEDSINILELSAKIFLNNMRLQSTPAKLERVFEISNMLLKSYMKALAKKKKLPDFSGPYWQRLEMFYLGHKEISLSDIWQEYQAIYSANEYVVSLETQEGLNGGIRFGEPANSIGAEFIEINSNFYSDLDNSDSQKSTNMQINFEVEETFKKHLIYCKTNKKLLLKVSSSMSIQLICFLFENHFNLLSNLSCKLLTKYFNVLREENNNTPDELRKVFKAIKQFCVNAKTIEHQKIWTSFDVLWMLLSCTNFLAALPHSPYDTEQHMMLLLDKINSSFNPGARIAARHGHQICNMLFQIYSYNGRSRYIYLNCILIIEKIISKLYNSIAQQKQVEAVIESIQPFLKNFTERVYKNYSESCLNQYLSWRAFFTIEQFLQRKAFGRISLFSMVDSRYLEIYDNNISDNDKVKCFLEMVHFVLSIFRENSVKMPFGFVCQMLKFPCLTQAGWPEESFENFSRKCFETNWSELFIIECSATSLELCAEIIIKNTKAQALLPRASINTSFLCANIEVYDILLKNYMKAAAKQQVLPNLEGPYWRKLERLYARLAKESPSAYWNECQKNYILQSTRVESGVFESGIQEALSGFINFPLEGESTQQEVLNDISHPELAVLSYTQRAPEYVVEQNTLILDSGGLQEYIEFDFETQQMLQSFLEDELVEQSMVIDCSPAVDLCVREQLSRATEAQDLQQSAGQLCAEAMDTEPPTPITEQEKPLQSFDDLDYQSLTLEKLQQLSTNCRIFTEDFFFPIHQKYLQGSKTAAVPVGLRVKRKSAQEESLLEMRTYQLQSLSDLVVPESSMVLGTLQQSYETEAYSVYTSGPLNPELPAITVFAGRKELALLPHTQGVCVFIVITEGEFSELRSHYPKLAGLGYHLLVLKAPIGIHPETEKIEVMSSQEAEAGKLTARRRAALLLGYDLGFETVLMFDDNIQSISYAKTSEEMGAEDSWEFALRSLLEKHAQSGSIVTTVQTYNLKKTYADQAAHRIGWKLLMVDMVELSKILTREQSYFLFPCSLSASSEDAFLQIMIHIAAQSLGSAKKGFTRLAQQDCYLVRSRNYRILNSCVRSGVLAQEIGLAEHEARAAQSYLEPRLFEALRMTNFIFNNNLSLNRACQTMANERRVAVDIGTRVLKKRTIEGLAESCYAIPKEAATFQQALLAISDAAILNLRTPQENCLKAIAAERESPSELLVCTLPTGVGKTRIEAYVSYAMLHAYPTMHSIIVAPTRLLSGQIDNDFYIEGHNIVQDRDSLIPVYSGASSNTASSLGFLLQNTTIKSSMSGKIFIFCQKSFESLCEKAQATSVQHNPSALELLSRTKMIIFDEEHLTFSKDARSCLEQIQQVTPLPELSHMLGFTATSPKERQYSDSCSAADIAARRIIFSYAPKQAVIDGYIRPLIYKGAECSLESLGDFMIRSRFTDKTPLLEHVGIMVCSSIAQLKTIAAVFKEKLTGTSVYSIYNEAPGYMESIKGFSEARSHALALVVNMLQEGYNQPQVRYTISLRKNIRASSKEQRAGRSRRKISQDDSFQALFISVKLLEQKEGQGEEYRFSGSKRPLEVVSEVQGLDESVAQKACAPVVLSSSSSGTQKRKTIYLG